MERVLIFFVLMAFLAGGCQTMMPRQDPAASLDERVNDMMTAKVSQDWAGVYRHFSPEYKKRLSEEAFVNRQRQVTFTGYNIKSVDILPSGSNAVVEVGVDMSGWSFEFKDQRDLQHWVMINGKWFLDVEGGKAKKRPAGKGPGAAEKQ